MLVVADFVGFCFSTVSIRNYNLNCNVSLTRTLIDFAHEGWFTGAAAEIGHLCYKKGLYKAICGSSESCAIN